MTPPSIRFGVAARYKPAASRLLVVAALTGLAIAQPVFDLFGNSPETFQANRATGGALVVFGLAVVVVPAVVLWLPAELCSFVSTRLTRGVHLATVFTLAAITGALLAKELAGQVAVHIAVGLALGSVVIWGYRRSGGVRSWLRLLAAANLLFLAQFLWIAPASDLLAAGEQTVTDYGVELVDPPSVVMIVLDELPTQSIIDATGEVDAVRFPNLAEFATTSTWYRHFTTVSPWTPTALPSLLDGRDPQGEPVWQDHPDSLFTLLAPTHHLIVGETMTSVCGLAGCGPIPVPPPPDDGDGNGVPDAPLEETTIDAAPRWRRLAGDTWDAWFARARPGSDGSVETFDDFAEEFGPDPTAEPDDADDPNADLDEDQLALEVFLGTLVEEQPRRHTDFLDALRPTDQPFLGFLHLMLPHQPWSHREDGTIYEVAAGRFDFAADNADPWPVRVSRQRHLIQTQYSDRLLGQLLDHLEDVDEFDDTIVVVVADHGAAFEAGESSRRLTERTLHQVAYSPLFIKVPGQSVGAIDDRNLNSTDVVPTIAELLGFDLPWDADGTAANDPAISARADGKYIHDVAGGSDGIVRFRDGESFAEVIAGVFTPIGPDDDPIAGLYRTQPGADLVGTAAADSFVGGGDRTRVAALDRLERPGDGPLLGEIAGRLENPVDDATVVVAVNDRVVGVSPLYTRNDGDGSWVVLLPADALRPDANIIRVGLLEPDGRVSELAIIEGD